jgi:two-component system response regulator DegU
VERLRVLIADDHTLFRYGMQGLLSTQQDIEVVGEAAGGGRSPRAGR